MPSFISTAQASKLRKAVKRHKHSVKLGKPWNKWTDEELWLKVLGQVVVIGKAEPGERLQHDPKIASKVSLKKLNGFRRDVARQKYLHEQFVKLRVRFSLGSSWENDWKAKASVQNFRVLRDAGGPKKFFQTIDDCKTEEDRIKTLQGALKRYGSKSVRDTLIELRLAENCMALDARIYGLLRKVGVLVNPDDIYRQVEAELIHKVAAPLGMTGALLDRILFRNYDQILKQR